jgi:hypothetical protein
MEQNPSRKISAEEHGSNVERAVDEDYLLKYLEAIKLIESKTI